MAVLYKSGERSPPSVGPVREPAFTETLQIGIVARADRDLGVVLEIFSGNPEDPE